MTARIITITSGKGGVGKTTATANISVALAELGKKVTCIDSDIGLRNLDVVLGLENRIVYDVVDVIEGHCKVNQAMIRDKRFENLFLIPAAQTRDKNSVTPAEMIDLCESIRPEMDFILIDSPAGIEGGFKNAIAPADEAIVITNPDVSAVRDADRIIGLIEAAEKGPARLILNRINPDMIKRGDMMEADDVLELLAVKLLGIVPEDENVLVSTNKGQPVVLNPKSRAGQAFRNVALRLTGQDVPFVDLNQKDDFIKRISKVFNKEG
ncbi:MAG: septum site-determining protein MinD [Chloroflexi bacterium]|nr:septum site-determining protein MinD [Chloroflexota bacterium]